MSEAPGAWKYYVTGVSEYPKGHKCSQQSSNLKGDGYIDLIKYTVGVRWLALARCLVFYC